MTSPIFRAVDQHTGEIADHPNNKFFEACDMADDIITELETLRAQQADRDELELELAEAKQRNLALVKQIAVLRKQLGR